MEKLIAACGIDCSACECRQATLANDNEKRAEVATKWSKNYDSDIKAEQINCMGCMEAGAHFGHCNECDYRACVRAKGLTSCAKCSDYPCEMLQQFFGYVPAAKANLEELRK
jgi:hypothetical protein